MHSTRSVSVTADCPGAILRGMAPDGGLFVPEIPADFSWKALLGLDTFSMAREVLRALLPGVEPMDRLVREAYEGKFETPHLTPLVPVGNQYVLELFRGPTSAFKDVALSMLPRLITATRGDRDVLILTATSGDTGKAALAGFRDVPGTHIIVFYPAGGVSPVQEAQMVTQEGQNVAVCAVRGNFDDAQTGVKEIFARGLPRDSTMSLSSANSINIGRLAPQVVYYFRAYSDLVERGAIRAGDPVDFTVPTGNFGDILAGYLAKCLGLPVGKLVCASNRNNVLTDFFRTGTYDRRRPFHRTLSPSMDILISSNLERLLYLLSGDCALVAALQKDLKEQGFYTVPRELHEKMQELFAWGDCSDEETLLTIGEVWKLHGYLMDTHTAVAWRVSRENGSSRPMVVLSTASPYKFPHAVLRAISEQVPEDEFEAMETLRALTGVPVPPQLEGLRAKPRLHRDEIDCDAMYDYVLEKVKLWQK